MQVWVAEGPVVVVVADMIFRLKAKGEMLWTSKRDKGKLIEMKILMIEMKILMIEMKILTLRRGEEGKLYTYLPTYRCVTQGINDIEGDAALALQPQHIPNGYVDAWKTVEARYQTYERENLSQ
jgi:hypothetical protein